MAAGLGFKTFTTGEVLTAADTNGYLMQGINVFASTAARDAAITSPQEGQFAFTKDTNGLWYYDGAAWVASGATGDIEGVTAGVGITGGGTSGTVTITNDMATTITASGDIVVGTGSGTYDNLPIGTTNQVLTADTTVSPYKVKWATAASGGGMTVIASGSIANSATGFSITSIPATYYNLQLVIRNSYSNAADVNSRIRLNNLSSGIYFRMQNYGLSTTTYAAVGSDENMILLDNFNSSRAANSSVYVVNFWDYAGNSYKSGTNTGFHQDRSTGTYEIMTESFGVGLTSAIDRIDLITGNANTFAGAGTYTLYGVK